MFDEARALYGTVRMCQKTQDELAKALGVSQSFVANKLRLLRFSHFMQEKIIQSGISERHARTILRLNDEAQQYIALKNIIDGSLSVMETEELIEQMLSLNESEEVCKDKLISDFKDTLDDGAKRLLLGGIGIKRELLDTDGGLYINIVIEK